MKISDISLISFFEETSIPFMIIEIHENKIKYISRKLLEKLGFSEKEIKKVDITSLFTEEFLNTLERKLKKSNNFEMHSLIKAHNNEFIPFRFLISKPKNNNFVFIQFLEIQKTLMNSERKSIEIIDTIFTLSNNLLVIIDKDGKIRKCNDALLNSLGYKQGEIEDMYFWMLVPKNERNEIKEYFHNELKCAKKVFNQVLNILSKSNDEIKVSWTYSLICKNGKVDHIVATGVNLLAQEQVLSQIQARNDLLETLLSILRHDLQNDLVITEGMIELFYETKQNELLDRALQSLNRSFELIQRISIIHETLTKPITLTTTSLKDIIERIKVSYLAEPIDISVEGDGSVKCDMLLLSALSNIIRNAQKHGNATKIDFVIKQKKSQTELYIINNGEEIDTSIEKDIFKKGVSSSEERGKGLGLYIVKKIIERCNGTVELVENKKGRVVFKMAFPNN